MLHSKIHLDEPTDPLGALFHRNDDPECSRIEILPPLSLAGFLGEIDVVHFLHRYYESDTRADLDDALFLANRQGHTETATLLLDCGAKPAAIFSRNGMHGAAWRGLNEQIIEYVGKYEAKPDVIDGSSATPIIYAMLGVQDEKGSWETIKCLFELGASPLATFSSEFGNEELSYAEIAQQSGKVYLARKLDELCYSPTIPNSSRESSCSIEREDGVHHRSKRLREDPEVDIGVKRARGA